MRAFNLILVTALVALWGYFLAEVAPQESAPPVRVPADGAELSAATLNNEGVRAARAGRHGDALAYLERARDFRPLDPVIAANVARQRARMEKRAWLGVLGAGTALGAVWIVATGAFGLVRRVREGARLRRVRLRGDPWIHIPSEGTAAEMPLHFSEPVGPLVRRHPLTIVWSSAAHGKHMKSRPPVEVAGRVATVRLDRERLERLRRYPGDWRGFLYLGKTPVGETAARVG